MKMIKLIFFFIICMPFFFTRNTLREIRETGILICGNTDAVLQCLQSLLQFAYVVVIFVYEIHLVIILFFSMTTKVNLS